MFHPALMMLIRLQWKGGLRQFRRSLRTFRGLFQLGFVVAMLLYGAVSMYFVGRIPAGPGGLAGGPFGLLMNDLLSVGLFAATCCVVLFSSGEASVYFTAGEVAFLFPAPVSRKQLLTYKLFKSLMGIMAVSLIFMLFSASSLNLSLPRLVGTILTISFFQLLTMNIAFARQIMQEKIHLLVRRCLGAILGVLVVIAIYEVKNSIAETDLTALAKAFHSSIVGKSILAPFTAFAVMLRVTDLQSFLTSLAIVLMIDGLLLVSAYRLDALSLEAAFAISEKMTARIKRVQTKGVWQALGTTTSAAAKRRVPQLPFWGGVGPVVWQRMTTTFRASTQLFWMLAGAVVFTAALVYMVANGKEGRTAAPFLAIGAMGYMSVLICLTLQNDIERVGFLKSLPIRTVSIVVGEMLGFVVILSTIQVLFLSGIAYFFPERFVWLLVAMSLTVPLNFLTFGVDKLVFYIYPTRLAKGAPGDFQNSGKQMIFMALKMCILGACVLVMALATLPAALLFQSPVAAVLSAVVVLLIECVAVIPLLGIAFDRFDPGVTMVN